MNEPTPEPGPLLGPHEQAAFAQSVENVRRAGAMYLAGHRAEDAVIAFVANVQHGVDGLVAKARADGKRIDCEAGCSHCCKARVETSAPEVFAIVTEIDGRPTAERTELIAALERRVALPSQADATWATRSACPFLIDHLCSIYAVRPTACRKAHSTDVTRCASYAPFIPQDLALALGAQALIRGTTMAYADFGVDATGVELVGAVVAALHDPSMRRRWVEGESVFATGSI